MTICHCYPEKGDARQGTRCAGCPKRAVARGVALAMALLLTTTGCAALNVNSRTGITMIAVGESALAYTCQATDGRVDISYVNEELKGKVDATTLKEMRLSQLPTGNGICYAVRGSAISATLAAVVKGVLLSMGIGLIGDAVDAGISIGEGAL